MSLENLAKLAELEPWYPTTPEEKRKLELFRYIQDMDEETKKEYYRRLGQLTESIHRQRVNRWQWFYQTFGMKHRPKRLVSIPKKYKEE